MMDNFFIGRLVNCHPGLTANCRRDAGIVDCCENFSLKVQENLLVQCQRRAVAGRPGRLGKGGLAGMAGGNIKNWKY